MMIMIGVYQTIVGLAALLDDQFYVVTPAYAYRVDVTAWGWIHLFLGIFVVLAGWAVIAGRTWGRVVGVVMAVLSAIANFFFIPYYPFWSLLIIGLDVFVIWALCVYGSPVDGPTAPTRAERAPRAYLARRPAHTSAMEWTFASVLWPMVALGDGPSPCSCSCYAFIDISPDVIYRGGPRRVGHVARDLADTSAHSPMWRLDRGCGDAGRAVGAGEIALGGPSMSRAASVEDG